MYLPYCKEDNQVSLREHLLCSRHSAKCQRPNSDNPHSDTIQFLNVADQETEAWED